MPNNKHAKFLCDLNLRLHIALLQKQTMVSACECMFWRDYKDDTNTDKSLLGHQS
jgi:hypothetical protein